jgi:hypothetical protein
VVTGVSEAFIYYEFYRVGALIKKSLEKIDDELEFLLFVLDLVVNDARKEGVDLLQINMETVRNAVQDIKNSFGEKLGMLSKMVVDEMRSKLLKLVNSRICTYNDLDELTKRVGKDRAVIECYKQNIVACRDESSKFIDLKENEKMLNVVYFLPSGEVERIYIKYSPGREKIKPTTPPIVPAVYEKCLGVKVELEKRIETEFEGKRL